MCFVVLDDLFPFIDVKLQLQALRAANAMLKKSDSTPTTAANDTNVVKDDKKPPKTEAELKGELAALAWKRVEIILDLIRRHSPSFLLSFLLI